jgi:Bacterial extracellular solute-binding protein
MYIKSIVSAVPALGALSILLAGFAQAAELKVMNSGGFAAAYLDLVPAFERVTGNTVTTAWGPSMGTTPDAIPVRLQRGEPVDVVIMVGYALGDLIKQGKVVADSRVDLARSKIGMAVRAGAPKPNISSPPNRLHTPTVQVASMFQPSCFSASGLPTSSGPRAERSRVSGSVTWSPAAKPRSDFSRSASCFPFMASILLGRSPRSFRKSPCSPPGS